MGLRNVPTVLVLLPRKSGGAVRDSQGPYSFGRTLQVEDGDGGPHEVLGVGWTPLRSEDAVGLVGLCRSCCWALGLRAALGAPGSGAVSRLARPSGSSLGCQVGGQGPREVPPPQQARDT